MAQHGSSVLFYLFLLFSFCISERHECDRLCLENEPPKKCFYQFKIGISQEKHGALKNSHRQLFLSVNGQSPGPEISVCENDTILINVKNQLPFGMETSLHWHGFEMGNSPFMDGVPMITQCPIFSHTSFMYQIKAHKSGTFYYHAHTVAQQLDGIYGPIVVHKTKNQDYLSRTIIISPQMKNVQVLESSYEADLNVTELRLHVFDGSAYSNRKRENMPERFRIINAAALDCPVTLFTHTVPLKVIAADGNDIKPFSVNEVVINPGERIDLLVKPEVMKVTHIVGHNLCRSHAKYGFDPGISEKSNSVPSKNNLNLNRIKFLEKLVPGVPEKLAESDLNIYLPFDTSVYKDFNGLVDFRYTLGSVVINAPSFLTKHSISVLQVHNKTFLYPSSPILSQPQNTQEDIVCNLEEYSSSCLTNYNGFCECLNIINLPYNKNLNLFLIDEGKTGNASQTVHVHGFSFYVISMKSFDAPIRTDEIKIKEAHGEIAKNLVNPPKKDTVVVPNKGYTILRIQTNNPGKWLLESITSKARTGSGLEVILNVENPSQDQRAPEGFPACGSMKEPDLVFGPD